MRKEDFFEVLGELDDDIVKEAKTPIKKELNWKIWGNMAACLAVILFIGVFALNSRQNDDIDAPAGDLQSMIYVNDTLYVPSTDQQGYPELKDDFIYLGKIVSEVTNSEIPKENFQANDPIVGCEVYQYGENIVVKFNDTYWLHYKYGTPQVTWKDLLDDDDYSLHFNHDTPKREPIFK